MTSMIEGNSDNNTDVVQRLHGILRPFILRRLKKDVEKQMPGKFEHIVKCQLSRRQMYLYEEFMARSSTRHALKKSGNFMAMMNVLMQLRKVCNHPVSSLAGIIRSVTNCTFLTVCSTRRTSSSLVLSSLHSYWTQPLSTYRDPSFSGLLLVTESAPGSLCLYGVAVPVSPPWRVPCHTTQSKQMSCAVFERISLL